jgi:Holliday junction resolvase RusA-like endonuclease
MEISFFVAGIPQPAGSKRGFFNKKINRVIITDANPKSRDWKTSVAQVASEAVKGMDPLTGPLKVRFDFIFPRPKGHYRTGKHKGEIRDSAPQYPDIRPDCSKSIRGTEDALTGIIWKDDAQIVTQIATKRYGIIPGCNITVRPEA